MLLVMALCVLEVGFAMIRLLLAPRSVSLVFEGDWIGYLGHVGC